MWNCSEDRGTVSIPKNDTMYLSVFIVITLYIYYYNMLFAVSCHTVFLFDTSLLRYESLLKFP